MLCKAVKSFVSVVNMRKGETVDITDTELATKLIDSGYVEKVSGDDTPVKTRKARTKKEEV